MVRHRVVGHPPLWDAVLSLIYQQAAAPFLEQRLENQPDEFVHFVCRNSSFVWLLAAAASSQGCQC